MYFACFKVDHSAICSCNLFQTTSLKTNFYIFFISPLIYLLIILLMTACGGGNSGDQRPGGPGVWGGGGRDATSVEIAPVSTSSISDQIRSYGTIRSQDVVSIIPQVSNRITRIHADLGDTVQQGDVLASIYDVPFRDALEQVEAQFRQSQSALQRDSSAFDRQRLLFERGASSSSEFENARSAYESSRAQYESSRAARTQSREDLQNTEIRSPVDGVVINRNIAEGDLARTGEPAFEIANLVGFETRLFLPMQDWEDISIGLPVTMSLSNRDGIVAEGVVSRVSPQLNASTGLGEVVVTLTDAYQSIRQGVLVESRITLITYENTIVIPRSAMIEQIDTYIEPETNTVEISRNYISFVAEGDTIARQRNLELGLQQGERVEIISGLEEGEKLIVTGQRNLSDGDRIRIAGQMRQAGRDQRLGEEGLSDGERVGRGERADGGEGRSSGQSRSGGNR